MIYTELSEDSTSDTHTETHDEADSPKVKPMTEFNCKKRMWSKIF